jgi:hypothetical protein
LGHTLHRFRVSGYRFRNTHVLVRVCRASLHLFGQEENTISTRGANAVPRRLRKSNRNEKKIKSVALGLRRAALRGNRVRGGGSGSGRDARVPVGELLRAGRPRSRGAIQSGRPLQPDQHPQFPPAFFKFFSTSDRHPDLISA